MAGKAGVAERVPVNRTREMELFLAVAEGDIAAVDALLDGGADPNRSLAPDEFLFCLGERGRTSGAPLCRSLQARA